MSFFESTPLLLGSAANMQGAVPGGRWMATDKPGDQDLTGSWPLSFANGASVRAVGVVRLRDIATGDLWAGNAKKFQLRMGMNNDLANNGGQAGWNAGERSAGIGFWKPLPGEFHFADTFTFSTATPRFGVTVFDVPQGHLVEVEITEIDLAPKLLQPWEQTAEKVKVTFAVQDMALTPGVTRPQNILIAPNATVAHAKIEALGLMDGEIAQTFAVTFNCTQASGGYATTDITLPFYYVTWKPGDDPVKWVSFPIKKLVATTGAKFRIGMGNGSGINDTGFSWWFEVQPGAVNELPAVLPQEAPVLEIKVKSGAVPTAKIDPQTAIWTDSGYYELDANGKPVNSPLDGWEGPLINPNAIPCLQSRLPFGYAQADVAQNGAMINSDAFPNDAIRPHERLQDASGRWYINLHADKFPAPIAVNTGTRRFPYQGAALTTRRLPEWRHKRGLWQSTIVLPNHIYLFPADWHTLVRLSVEKGKDVWPGENDGFEGFYGFYNGGFTPRSVTSALHAGVHGSNSEKRVIGFGGELDRMGFAPDTDLWTQIHTLSRIIEEKWCYWAWDGVVFNRCRNLNLPADGNEDYGYLPTFNITWRAPDNVTIDPTRSLDMKIYDYRHYAYGDYELVPFTKAKPYPLRIEGAELPTWTVDPWVKGTNTTMTEPTTGVMRFANAGGNPRGARKITGLTAGAQYRVTFITRAMTATQCIYRVSATANLTASDYGFATKLPADVDQPAAITFTAPASGIVYAGAVGVTTTSGQYIQCDKDVTLVAL